MQLVQRFYDVHPGHGQILFDGKDITTLAPNYIRNQIGIVSQEPNLFDLTIRENIAYGLPEDQVVSMEEIIEAAKEANIHEFIESLPKVFHPVSLSCMTFCILLR